jgi:hypothetical protein
MEIVVSGDRMARRPREGSMMDESEMLLARIVVAGTGQGEAEP